MSQVEKRNCASANPRYGPVRRREASYLLGGSGVRPGGPGLDLVSSYFKSSGSPNLRRPEAGSSATESLETTLISQDSRDRLGHGALPTRLSPSFSTQQGPVPS